MVNLTINGIKATVEKGTSILDAAKSVGITIPTLCYLKDINEIGACRICVVEVEGKDKLLAACDCVISSSRQEGLPMNLIEAAASGRYIIATNVRGNADVVKESGFGALVELNDDEAMAREIRRAMANQGTCDLSRVRLFDEKEIVKTVMELYQQA